MHTRSDRSGIQRSSALARPFLGLKHRTGAAGSATATRPDFQKLGGVALVQSDLVVVGQLFAVGDITLGFDHHKLMARIVVGGLMQKRLAIRIAAVVDVARVIAILIGINDVFIVKRKQEGMPAVDTIAILFVCLGMGQALTFVFNQFSAGHDVASGKYTMAMDRRKTRGDIGFHARSAGNGAPMIGDLLRFSDRAQ